MKVISARMRYGAAAVAVAVAGGIALSAGTPAHATTSTALDLPGYGDLVVDDNRDHVFVSGGPSSNGVLVTELSGHVVRTITGQYGATGLALDIPKDRLYVANAAGDAISVVSLRTLKEIDRIATGAQTCPTHLTRVGKVLWFGYGCDGTWNGGIGKVEFPPDPEPEPRPTYTATPPGPTTSPTAVPTVPGTPSPRPTGSPTSSPTTPPPPPPPTVTLNTQGDVRFQRAPLLTALPDGTSPLVAGQPQLSRSTVYVYDITATNTLATRTSGTAPGSNLHDIALDDYGQTLFTGAGSRNAAPAYSTVDLSGRGSYYTGYYPLAVAASPDGFHLAAGVRSTGDDVYIYEIGGVVPERRIDLSDDVLAPRGLTWSPDSDTLYAVTVPPAGGAPTLRVLRYPVG